MHRYVHLCKMAMSPLFYVYQKFADIFSYLEIVKKLFDRQRACIRVLQFLLINNQSVSGLAKEIGNTSCLNQAAPSRPGVGRVFFFF